jgi:hypothetical protein
MSRLKCRKTERGRDNTHGECAIERAKRRRVYSAKSRDMEKQDMTIRVEGMPGKDKDETQHSSVDTRTQGVAKEYRECVGRV